MKKLLIPIVLVAAVSLTRCKHEPVLPELPPSQSLNCNPDTVYFTNDVLPFFVSNCARSGCHDEQSARDGVILTDYESIMNTGDITPGDPFGSESVEVMLDQNPRNIMPPPSVGINLTQDQINMVTTWISQGALNNSCLTAECDSVNISFSGHIQPLIQNRCLACHVDNNSIGGLGLSNYNEVLLSVNDGFYESINHDSGWVSMPQNQPKMDSCSLQIVRVWIEEGTQNN